MIKIRFESQMKPVLSQKEVEDVCTAMNLKHKPWLEDESFLVEHGETPYSLQVRVTLMKNDGSKSYPVELLCLKEGLSLSKMPISEVFYLFLDYFDVYFTEYLTSERDTFMTLDWNKFICEETVFYMRGSIRFNDLEAQADALFQKFGTGGYEITSISPED